MTGTMVLPDNFITNLSRLEKKSMLTSYTFFTKIPSAYFFFSKQKNVCREYSCMNW